jgi:serine/threonine protein kinase
MKLLPGESLAARLDRLGPRSSEEAACIITQVAAGIAAAHDAGILHRDIKAANIMVDGLGNQVHACVTDFGLARGALGESTSLTVGGIAGTPAYMAPELLLGSAPSKASDVYAFGVVAYQTFTGHLPKRSLQNGHARKNEALDATLPAPWGGIIRRCLEPDLSHRVQDVAEALEPVRLRDRNSLSQFFSKTLTRRNLIIGGSAWAAAVAGGAWFGWDEILDLLHPLPERLSVALMPWPPSGSADLLSNLLDSIGQRLIRVEARNKSRNFVVWRARDILPGTRPILSPQDAGEALGATLVLAASLNSKDKSQYLDLQLLSVGTRDALRKAILPFVPSDVSAVCEKASHAVIRMLRLSADDKPLQESDELRQVSPEVYQAFSEAQSAAQAPNNTGLDTAISRFQKVLEMDPHLASAYAELAITYVKRFNAKGDRGNLTLAAANSRLALEYNPNSSRALLSAAQIHLYSGEPAVAMEYFDKALAIDPENPEILLYKAQAYRFSNEPKKAEDVYRAVNISRPNYWMAYNELGYMLSNDGDHLHAAEAFKAAKAAAPPVALPQANLGAEYLFLGKIPEAKHECEESIQKSPTDMAHRTLGDIAFFEKDYHGAKFHYRQAANLNPNFHDNWRDLGDAEAMLGNQNGVKEDYAKAAEALQDSIPQHSASAYAWATLAFYFAKVGDKVRSESALKKAGPAEAGNLETQLMMIQAIRLLGRKEEALNLLLHALDRGLAPIQVEFALDLKDLRTDPRYLARLAKLKQAHSKPIV